MIGGMGSTNEARQAASNAVVGVVGMYSKLLGEAHAEIDQLRFTVAEVLKANDAATARVASVEAKQPSFSEVCRLLDVIDDRAVKLGSATTDSASAAMRYEIDAARMSLLSLLGFSP